jgi:hypothetical protein
MDRASNLTNGTGAAIRGIHGDSALAAELRGGVRMTRMVAAAMLCLLGLSAQGCHGDSSQQQFMNALNRGNGAQASQLWLKMSAKDRSNLSHNIGLKPNVDKDDIGRALLKHQQQEEAKNGEDPDPTMSAGDDGETDSQQIEIPGFDGDPTAGGLSNLPLLNTPQQSAPITQIGPQ